MTKAEIVQATALAERQVGTVLGRNDQFDWVARGRIAPRGWGLPTYRGTERALVEELVLMGGTASREDLIRRVCEKFDCTEASANIYLAASPYFALREQHVSLAPVGKRQEFSGGHPSRQKRVYDDLHGGLVWGIDVDSNMIRGSGRAVPASIAAALGADPVTPVGLDLPGATVTIGRAGTIMAISSLRKVAQAVAATPGDRLVLRVPSGGEWSLDLARHRSAGLQTAIEFVGMGDRRGDARELIAMSRWESDASLLLEALWDRKETRILTLLAEPDSDPRGELLDLRRLDRLLAGRLSRRRLADEAGIGTQGLASDGGKGLARLTARQLTLVCRRVADLLGEPMAAIESVLFEETS